MQGVYVVKYSNLPDMFAFAPYFIVVGFSEEELIDGVYSVYGKPLIMWDCDNVPDARKWIKYLQEQEE